MSSLCIMVDAQDSAIRLLSGPRQRSVGISEEHGALRKEIFGSLIRLVNVKSKSFPHFPSLLGGLITW